MKKIRTNKVFARAIAVICALAMMMPLTIAMASGPIVTLSSVMVGETELPQTAADAPVIASGSSINVAGEHSIAGGEVTFLVTPTDSNTPIRGIGQQTSDESNGTFTFTVALPIVMDEGTYELRVGGEDVESPAMRYFKIVQGLVKSVELTSDADSIKTISGTLDLSAQIINSVVGDMLAWSVVSGSDVASVDQTGKVTALKDGVAVVRAALSTNPAVYAQKTIVVDTAVVAPVTLEISIAGAGRVQSTGAYDGDIAGGDTTPYPVGSQFELTAVANGNDKFIHWIDVRSGRVVSTEAKYSFALGTSLTLRAVFRPETDPGLVIFMEKNNMVRESNSVTNAVTVPNNPYYMGYDFKNWYDKKNSSVASFKAGDVIPANTYVDDTIFIANHTLSEDEYTVTFTGVEGLITGQYRYDSRITVTPMTPEAGKKFAYWKKDGKIVSYENSYTFYVGAYDTTVEAVFDEEDAVIASAPVIVMSEPIIVSGNNIAFFAERNLPAKYKLLENGIILSSDTSSELTLANAQHRGISISVKNIGQYTIRKSNVSAGQTWAARAYMIYEDGNNIITVYSNTVTKTLN